MLFLKTLLFCLVLVLFLRSAAFADTGIVGWNAYSKQFIDSPTFKLLAVPGTVAYRATVKQDKKSWQVSSKLPVLNLAKIWTKIPAKTFTLTIDWLGVDGKMLETETSTRVKAPDWKGLNEPEDEWVRAADRNVEYLLGEAENSRATYKEPGVPIIVWSITSPDAAHPDGFGNGYPCISINYYIWAFKSHVERGGENSKRAMKAAIACADWALKNRLPADAALPLFPYSTISNGKFDGGAEGMSVNLMRACLFGVSMVDMYKATRDARYLEYAKHIATTAAKFQNADGSFPYRVLPKTGAVTEQYACNAIEFTTLVDALESFSYDRILAKASRRAVDWMVAYVSSTNHWQAAYEDVVTPTPYTNLSQMQVLPLIRYLCKHKNDDPAYLKLAVKLNRWVEDQFVTFGPESEAYSNRVKGPMVFEQFACWAPMEFHTANWIDSLIALHKATGKLIYLEKATAAANAICAQQFSNGAFSTWGYRHYENGKLMPDTDPGANWYNCNAYADYSLYELDKYVNSLKTK